MNSSVKTLVTTIAFLFFTSTSFAQRTSQQAPLRLQLGEWRGVLTLNDSTELPFSFTVDLQPRNYTLTIHNGEEKIPVEELSLVKDSINWHMPVFDSWFKCKIDSLGGFHGTFYNNAASKPYQVPFRAEFSQPRFDPCEGCFKTADFSGKWECTFSPGTSDSSKAIALFENKDLAVTGTFLTETGDYRFLEGAYTDANTIELSCFDGSHAFLFKAKQNKNGSVKGYVWYGKYGHESWTAKRNKNFQLRDPETLTTVKDSSKVNFTFNDLHGNPVSLSDPKFRGKVVVVQIMGSWCPNCMDETAWLSEVYKKYNPKGLEIIGLAYERSADTAKSNANIARLKNHYGAGYTFLNTNKSGAKGASESLPFLNGIMAFPTTIYIDRTGKIRMVYTGFNGPATGLAYEKDSAEILRFIQQLLAEPAPAK